MDKVAFLFSGQGSQYPGMMKDFYDSDDIVKSVFEKADLLLERPISELCFFGAQNDLNLTENTQPCILTCELAVYQSMKNKGIQADAVAGFSLGEYGALVAAGALSLENAIKIIQIRANAMQEAAPVGSGSMLAVLKVSEETILSICKEIEGYIVPANYNCPGQIVLSGETTAIEQFIEVANKNNIRTIKIPVSAPFHCELMKPAVCKIEKALRSFSFSEIEIPCYSNVDGKPYTKDSDIAGQLGKQIRSPVLWEQTLRNMYEDGIKIYVEIGPGNTLSSFVRKTLKSVEIYNVSDVEGFIKVETLFQTKQREQK